MKQFIILFAVIATALSQDYYYPGELTADTYFSENNRIASGVAAKKGENLDFCYINVQFIQKSQVCGCVVYSEKTVATSGRCIYDPQEGKATNVTVTIFGLSGKAAIKYGKDWIIPDGVIGADIIAAPGYEYATDIPFAKIGANNIGIVKLATALTSTELDGKKVAKATLPAAAAIDFATFTTTYAKDYSFRTCGLGAIDNKGTKSKGLLCVDMDITKADDCKTAIGGEPMFPDDGTAVCVSSTSDKNVCQGDYGGPVWAYKYSTDGKTLLEQVLIGITVGSPNVRPNAPCQGGQTIVAMFLPGNVQKWLEVAKSA